MSCPLFSGAWRDPKVGSETSMHQPSRRMVEWLQQKMHKNGCGRKRIYMESSLREFLTRNGADIIGYASAENFTEWLEHFNRRISNGLFPSDYPDRLCSDPCKLLAGARSIIVFGVEYHGLSEVNDPGRGSVAGLMWIRRTALHAVDLLVGWLKESGANAVDGSLLPAKAVAVRAGIALQRKNTLAYFGDSGSAVRLGIVITDLELSIEDKSDAEACGNCTLCLEACPTGALIEGYVLDATKCLTYLTEEDCEFPRKLRPSLGNRLVGCDVCQLVCPHNKSVPRVSFEDQQWLELRSLAREAIADPDALNARFREDMSFYINSRHAPSRAIAIALENWGNPESIPLLREMAESYIPEVAEAARWALTREKPARS